LKIEFIASVAVITRDAKASRQLYMEALGLPLKQLDGDYFASEEVGGCKHFGVWPLEQAAEGAAELRSQGYQLLHDAKVEP
jgi:catechol 2,3-dioxygenase-like lactoylglutathione lyase family enzyme